MMTPEEISEHVRFADHLWAMPEPERAERLARLETALATDPPEDLAKRLRVLVGVFQSPRPLTRQEEIDRRFTGNHERAASIAVAREARMKGLGDPLALVRHLRNRVGLTRLLAFLFPLRPARDRLVAGGSAGRGRRRGRRPAGVRS